MSDDSATPATIWRNGARGRAAAALARVPAWLQPSFGDIVLLAFLQLLLAIPPYDTDLWWHLRTGEWILGEGAVPRRDFYSFTASGQPWIAHEWLSEVGLALAYRAAGLEAMMAIQAVAIVAALAVVYRHMRSDGAKLAVYLPMLVVALFLVLPAAHPRPYLMTLLFLALLLYSVHVHERNRWVLFVGVPALFALWANTHAGFAIGLGALALVAAGKAWEQRSVPLDWLAAAALATAACIVNPYGVHLLTYPLQYRTGSIHYALITEWASPDFHQPYSWLVAGFLAATIATLAGRKHPSWRTDSLLIAAFGAMALISVRNIPLLAVVGVPILARQLAVVRPGAATDDVPVPPAQSVDAGLLRRIGLKLRRLLELDGMLAGVPLTILAVALVAAGVARGPRTAKALNPATWSVSAGWDLPYAAVARLHDHGATGNLLNDYSWGGYLIWTLWPQERVFIDGRADVYGDEILTDYADTVGLAPGWSERLDEYGIGRVLLRPDEPLVEALRLHDGWGVTYEDETAVLMARRGLEHDAP